MGTKGASNRYGNARGGRQGHPTQHTGFAWAKAFNRSTLNDHFRRHGEQMGCPTKESYNASAVKFANTVDRKKQHQFCCKQWHDLQIQQSRRHPCNYHKTRYCSNIFQAQRRVRVL